MSNPKNKVQAPHHQIVAVEEAERAIKAGRAIGTNDIISHALRHLDPRVAAPMAHALSYQLRIGAKDDEQMEIEKAIWWLMDAHNRLSDIRGKDREYAPWEYTGKIKEVSSLMGGDDKDLTMQDYKKSDPEEEDVTWVKVENPFEVGPWNSNYFNPEAIKVGDTLLFENMPASSRIKNHKEYLVYNNRRGVLAVDANGDTTNGFQDKAIQVFKKSKGEDNKG